MNNKKEFRADLHCHSTCSDGSNSPMELLNIAKQAGLLGLSITDHDTIEAYTDELFSKSLEFDIRLLPGIELSTAWNETPVHILGYGFNLKASSIVSFIEENQMRRNRRNSLILEKLSQKKIDVTEEDLKTIVNPSGIKKSIGRPHIAEIMVRKGYVGSMQEAFDKYLKEGACCYVPGFRFTPNDAIASIQSAGGKAVLAHPHFIRKGKLLKFLLSLPFDGIECYYGTLHKSQEIPWVKIAREKGWIATGGSDYHGAFKPNIPLGCSYVDEPIFEKLVGQSNE